MVQGIKITPDVIVFSLILLFWSGSYAGELGIDSLIRVSTPSDTSQTISSYISSHVSEFATPDFIKQKKTRSVFQQKAYCSTLFDAICSDGFAALLSYVKMDLNIEFGLVHKTFVAYRVQLLSGGAITYYIPDNWEYPADPWKKEWWYYR
jgi:hypothetical protein